MGKVEASALARRVKGASAPALPTPLCSQMAAKSVQFLNTDAWSKALLLALTKPDQTCQEQPPEKVDHALPPHKQPPCLPRMPRGSGHRIHI